MTPQQFEQSSNLTKRDEAFAQQLALTYGGVVSDKVLALCETVPEGIFFDGTFCRKLSTSEILNAKEMLHVDFPAAGILPVFDCGDNDFIVYRLTDKKWVKFNIVDETSFSESEDWKKLI